MLILCNVIVQLNEFYVQELICTSFFNQEIINLDPHFMLCLYHKKYNILNIRIEMLVSVLPTNVVYFNTT